VVSHRNHFGLLATIISAVPYGIIIVLSGNCFLLLQKKRGIYSNRRRLFLILYVTVVFFLSTWSIIQSIRNIMLFIFPELRNPPFQIPFTWSPVTQALPLTVWVADGFMMWRCVVLYQDISTGSRILIIILLSLLTFISLVCGVAMILFFTGFRLPCCSVIRHLIAESYWVFISFSTLVNIILASLIVLRLMHHRKLIQEVLGADHGSPYSKATIICVESSALVVVFSVAYLALMFEASLGSLILALLLPHICVISPLLIVYRVARGRAMTTNSQPSEREVVQIRFNNPTSRRSSQEGEG